MFERFTDRARRVITIAQDVAREFNSDCINSEHLLVGLLDVEGLAAQVLESLGVDQTIVRSHLECGEKSVVGHLPFTPRTKTILELALREALQLGHNYIGVEHLLLAIITEKVKASDEGNSAADRVIEAAGSPEEARQAVIRAISLGRVAMSQVEDPLASVKALGDALDEEISLTYHRGEWRVGCASLRDVWNLNGADAGSVVGELIETLRSQEQDRVSQAQFEVNKATQRYEKLKQIA